MFRKYSSYLQLGKDSVLVQISACYLSKQKEQTRRQRVPAPFVYYPFLFPY